MDESSSGEKGEIGGTGDDLASDPYSISEGSGGCDACEGCDDVCDSKGISVILRYDGFV
jgi:hypothetical protein